MFLIVKSFDGSTIKKAFDSQFISAIVGGADTYKISPTTGFTVTARGSGYSDAEIAQNIPDIISSFGNGSGYKLFLEWGKGIADATINSRGKYDDTETPTVSIETENLTKVVDFAATAALRDVTSQTYQELNTITVTNPGVYTVTDPSQPYSLKIVLTRTMADTQEDDADLSSVVSNYLASVKALILGGGFSNATQTMTLDVPALKAGQASKAAAKATVSVASFKKARVTISGANSVFEFEQKAFMAELALRESLLYQGKTLPDGSLPGIITEKF